MEDQHEHIEPGNRLVHNVSSKLIPVREWCSTSDAELLMRWGIIPSTRRWEAAQGLFRNRLRDVGDRAAHQQVVNLLLCLLSSSQVASRGRPKDPTGSKTVFRDGSSNGFSNSSSGLKEYEKIECKFWSNLIEAKLAFYWIGLGYDSSAEIAGKELEPLPTFQGDRSFVHVEIKVIGYSDIQICTKDLLRSLEIEASIAPPLDPSGVKEVPFDFEDASDNPGGTYWSAVNTRVRELVEEFGTPGPENVEYSSASAMARAFFDDWDISWGKLPSLTYLQKKVQAFVKNEA